MAKTSKTTLEMKNELNECEDLEIFLKENEENFCHLSLEAFLERYLAEKQLKKGRSDPPERPQPGVCLSNFFRRQAGGAG